MCLEKYFVSVGTAGFTSVERQEDLSNVLKKSRFDRSSPSLQRLICESCRHGASTTAFSAKSCLSQFHSEEQTQTKRRRQSTASCFPLFSVCDRKKHAFISIKGSAKIFAFIDKPDRHIARFSLLNGDEGEGRACAYFSSSPSSNGTTSLLNRRQEAGLPTE